MTRETRSRLLALCTAQLLAWGLGERMRWMCVKTGPLGIRRRNTVAQSWEIRRSATRNAILHCIHHYEAEIIKTARPRLWLPVLVFLATLVSSSQAPSSAAEIKSPDLNLVLQRLEEVQHQDPARSRPYKVRREYKVFRGFDKQPTSKVMAQIDFVPPDMKTYKIIQTRGN
jgi:hypothetical protein